MGSSTTRLTWRRRFIFNALMLIGTWALIEAASCAATLLVLGPPGELGRQRDWVATQEPFNPGRYFSAPTVLHPYFGVALQTLNDGGKLAIDGKFRITEYGFEDEGPPLHQRSADRVIVGILGGSVARQFSQFASDTLAEELSQSPEFRGKKIQFVRLANNGFKQPQQLMIITYLLTLGAEFDLVINLDGLNESALPSIDNIPYGVNSAYPRDWGKIVATTVSTEFVRRGGYVSYLRYQQTELARWFGSKPWRYSPTALLVWGFRNHRADQDIMKQLTEMNQFAEKELSHCASGPPESFASADEIYSHCAELWTQSSILLHQLCAARGIRYFHFLQPNQYVPGSKQIGPEEARVAIREDCPISVAVRKCFPLLQAQAPRLSAAGVDFTDLTRVFADHPEPIYFDDCCHVITAGDLIMAKAIATRIRQASSHDSNP